MVKKDKKNKKEEEKPKKNNFKAFLKKRAPLYLAGIALIVISVNGVLSEKNLDDFLIDLSEEEQIVVDMLMQYNLSLIHISEPTRRS